MVNIAVESQNIDLPKMRELTCWECKDWVECKCAFDPYNTDGDCLMSK